MCEAQACLEAWKGVFKQMCLNMFKGTRNCTTPPGETVTWSDTQITQGVYAQMFKYLPPKCLNTWVSIVLTC